MEDSPIPKWLPTTAFFIGVAALAGVVVLVLKLDSPNPLQITTLRTITALAGAAFAMAFTGFLSLRLSLPGSGFIVAGGSLGVFVVLYFFVPDLLREDPKLLALQQEAINEVRALNKKITVEIDTRSDIGESELSELIALYTLRAEAVRRTLRAKIKYAPVAEYLKAFDGLHEQHLSALKNSHLILAAEVLRQIHTLSRELDRDEFWISHAIERPDVAYSLCSDAFSRGVLLETYAGSLVSESLAMQAGVYPDCQDYSLTPEQIQKSAKPEYLYSVLAIKQGKPN